MNNIIKRSISVAVVAGFALSASVAHANISMIKAYKTIYPDAKLKCIDCHAVGLPKKDDGAHDPNAYGKAVIEQAAKDAKEAAAAKEAAVLPTADTFKKVGSIEDFNKKLEAEKK